MYGFSPGIRFAALGVMVVLAMASGARAASDPARTWHSIESAHFAVHYYDDGREFAEAVAAYAEEAHTTLGRIFDWYPREKVHVAVFDEYDGANGFAASLPEPRMTIYAWPPTGDGELGHYTNWLKLLVFHEYAHIVHIDESHGIPDLVNAVFGRVWKPNQVLPRWIVEGIAVWTESRLTGGGRLGSGLMDMWLRVFSLADAWPELSELGGYPLRPPRGTLWYLIGGHIIDALVRGAGVEALAAFSEAYGGRVMPFGIQGLVRQVSGATWEDWYTTFRSERTAAVRQSVEAIGDNARTGVPVHANDDGIEHLRFSPDGKWLYWVENDGHVQGRIVRAATDALARAAASNGAEKIGIETIVRCHGGCSSIDISRDGARIAWTSQRFRRVGDLFGLIAVANLEGGRLDRRDHRLLPGTERAHDVAWSADGRSLWCVRARWGRTWLERFDVATGDSLQRIDAPPGLGGPGEHVRFERPTPTRDGRFLFVIAHTRGNRDIWRIALSTTGAPRFERWTRGGDDELDLGLFAGSASLEPHIIFSADRGGVFNVYAQAVAVPTTAKPLTTEIIGTIDPAISPDGRFLASSRPTTRGRELLWLSNPFEAVLPPVTERPLRPSEPPLATPVLDHPYDPMPTLMPRRWLPSLSFGNAGPGRIGFGVDHTDASRRIGATLLIDYDFGLETWSGFGRVAWRGGFVDLALDLGRYVYDRTSTVGDLDEPWRHEIVWGQIFAGLPVPDVFAGLFWGLGYTVELARGTAFGRLEDRPDQTTPTIPREGLSAAANLSFSFSDVRGYLFSPGPADGFAAQFNLAFRHPAIGSWNEAWTATTVMRGFVPMPWHDDHVLALRLGAGVTTGQGAGRSWFSLGGVPNRDLLSDLLNQESAGSVWLRGFPANAFQGDRFWLGTVEYRMPLWRVRNGPGTLPIFLEDLTLAVFADIGGATNEPAPMFPVQAGLGAELRVRTDLVWGLIHDFRLGYARGVGSHGVDSVYFLMATAP